MPRPHLGPRRPLSVKVKLPLHSAVKRAAAESGKTMTDFVTELLERAIEHAA